MTHAVVMRLGDPIKGRGHHVYMDNFYTSPQLFSDLCDNGFGACGTVRINRRGLPAAVKENVRKGEMKVIQMDNSMLAIKWMDKHAVTALTTIHDDTAVAVERRNRHAAGGRETVMKPQAIVEYNRYMGGVDHAHQLLSYYSFGHRTVKFRSHLDFHKMRNVPSLRSAGHIWIEKSDLHVLDVYTFHCSKTIRSHHVTVLSHKQGSQVARPNYQMYVYVSTT